MGQTTLTIVDGRIQPGGQLVGRLSSQLQAAIDGCFAAPLTEEQRKKHSVFNSSVLRTLNVRGEYQVDVPLNIPDLFVLRAAGARFTPAPSLSVSNRSRFAALVQLHGVSFSAVLGGTFDGSALPPHDPKSSHGLMALSIVGGSRNAIRGARALSNHTDSVIGINGSPHAEVAGCDVGGDNRRMVVGRCVWTLATTRALVHDNFIHNCSMHALDFDAYTSESVAYSNLAEGNEQEGIFLEETADHCTIFNNTCRHNENGIALYTLDEGPVTHNQVLNNRLVSNRRYGLSAGGRGHDDVHVSSHNVFAGNYIADNNLDLSPTAWGPAPTSQANPSHGAVVGDYWTNNAIVDGSVEGAAKMDYDGQREDEGAFVVFEPDVAIE